MKYGGSYNSPVESSWYDQFVYMIIHRAFLAIHCCHPFSFMCRSKSDIKFLVGAIEWKNGGAMFTCVYNQTVKKYDILGFCL